MPKCSKLSVVFIWLRITRVFYVVGYVQEPWTGDPNQIYEEDIGRYYSSGPDRFLFSLCYYVERILWNVQKTLPGRNCKYIMETDWLRLAFYAENRKWWLVRCIETTKMGYVYKPAKDVETKGKCYRSLSQAKWSLSKVLDGLVKITVPTPKESMSKRGEKRRGYIDILVTNATERSMCYKINTVV